MKVKIRTLWADTSLIEDVLEKVLNSLQGVDLSEVRVHVSQDDDRTLDISVWSAHTGTRLLPE